MKVTSVLAVILFTVFVLGCQQKSDAPIFYKSHESLRQDAPFSDVVESNGLLFLSGQLGMDHKTRLLVEGGIEAETKQCIENIKAVLEHHQSSLDKVVKCTVILKDINDFAAFNKIYTTYFPNKPARTTFAAAGLAANASIEIEVIASK
ncbi:MAG TPA: Rid family detoxifying hydrolase [Gelidibacter sp.]|uniref:RidA family protein n=1 Tax=Gelidibacter sp. TaxID=2018083 RepID=UPI002D1DC8B8|nr:Rid family detoxifying hydrolase [Gelidibacter sp.]HXJ99292.1 Rid family detoxifying hydrolase [Gelidibacter sp.]